MEKLDTKRSSLNVQNLNISPLAAHFPIGAEEDLPGYDTTRHASYIESRSIPTTPSILSQHSSATGLNTQTRSESHPHLTFSASASNLPSQDPSLSREHRAKKRSRRPGAAKYDDPQEWFLRAGAAISSGARESKGQSWLANRASSTSLAPAFNSNTEDYALSPPQSGTSTPRLSRVASRQHSRMPSARVSRVGSRVELLTPYGLRTPGQDSPDDSKSKRQSTSASGYFGNIDHENAHNIDEEVIDDDAEYNDFIGEGPDFVDIHDRLAAAEDEEDEDEEMSRLTRERGLGLGGIVDKFFGLSLFAVEEEENGEEGAVRRGYDGQEGQRDPQTFMSSTPPRNELAKKVVSQMVDSTVSKPEDDEDLSALKDGATAWQDAAWLVRVAARSFL
ncbi:MAG: hypothetical protein M4579_005933 [Chaenotheca gracillima]|nr:MAG: hypothetical protein M4579_005933 [Chaenotheca gracillima]